jgi:Uncharacterized conserved protein, COG2412
LKLIWTKIYRTSGEILLAAADEEIMGLEFKEGKYRIKVSEGFYKGQLVNEQQYIELFRLCTVANIVGSRAVEAAIKAGFIDRSRILVIGGVPHAQFSILEV